MAKLRREVEKVFEIKIANPIIKRRSSREKY